MRVVKLGDISLAAIQRDLPPIKPQKTDSGKKEHRIKINSRRKTLEGAPPSPLACCSKLGRIYSHYPVWVSSQQMMACLKSDVDRISFCSRSIRRHEKNWKLRDTLLGPLRHIVK